MIERTLPNIPPETRSSAGYIDFETAYHLVTPLGLAVAVNIEDAPLRTGQHQPTVHRAAFSYFQARTDDGLPGAGEAAVRTTLRADSAEELEGLIGDLRAVARDTTWLTHPIEGNLKLLPPVGVDVGAGGKEAELTLHLVAADLRRYRADGMVMP